MTEVGLSELARQRAESGGEVGRAWLDALPATVADLAARWGLEIGAPYDGGTAGYVTRAERADGTPVVLKVALPLSTDEEQTFRRSVRAHELAAGRGCVALLDVELDRHAMLLERLGSNLADAGFTIAQILDAVVDALREFWRPLPADHGLMNGAESAAWLGDFIVDRWNAAGQPCPRAVIDRALECCAARAAAHDPTAEVLVHADAHGWNTVIAGDGFKLVDPEGLASTPAHDLAVPMREYNAPLLAGDTARLVHERAEYLGRRADVDPVAVWEWGFIERVSTGLLAVIDFDDGDADGMLDVAARCC